jgi:hypothetical protein
VATEDNWEWQHGQTVATEDNWEWQHGQTVATEDNCDMHLQDHLKKFAALNTGYTGCSCCSTANTLAEPASRPSILRRLRSAIQ